MVRLPDDYRWSSYGINAWGDAGWLQSHDEYLHLSRTVAARCYACRALFGHRLSKENIHLIRKAAHYCQPIGDDLFRQQVEGKYGIKLGQMKRGRSRRKADGLVNNESLRPLFG